MVKNYRRLGGTLLTDSFRVEMTSILKEEAKNCARTIEWLVFRRIWKVLGSNLGPKPGSPD